MLSGSVTRHFRVALLAMAIFSLCLSIRVQADALTDIERQFHQDEYQSLLVGENQVVMLDQAATLPISHGVVVLLIERGAGGLNFPTAQSISQLLNQKGWRTLLIFADPPHLDTNKATDTPTPSPQTPSSLPANTSVLSHYADYDNKRQYTLQLANAAYNYCQQYQGYTLFIAQGMSAAVILDLTNSNQLDAPDTLVTIAPFWPERSRNLKIINWIGKSTYPLLDISIDSVNQWQSLTQEARYNAAQTNLKLYYRQRSLSSISLVPSVSTDSAAPDALWLGKEIYSWLHHLGW
jgi:putative hemolysin